MDTESDIPFLDVPALIERSQPHPRVGWFGYAGGVFLLIVLGSAYVASRSPELATLVDVLSTLAMVGIMVGLAVMTSLTVRAQREEVRRVEALEELVQLRHWPEAAAMAVAVLSQPTRTPIARVQSLILLSSILARYHRFEDAISVQNHLLETINFDDSTSHGIRLGRAMAMLREDHLVDADRAISDLRRGPHARESAGLALVELYRDVKTGHPHEAIERFAKSLEMFRAQLGHRTGDAYALLARAHDLLGYESEAQSAYEKATLLTSVAELHRRYPEVQRLAGRFQPALSPAGSGWDAGPMTGQLAGQFPGQIGAAA